SCVGNRSLLGIRGNSRSGDRVTIFDLEGPSLTLEPSGSRLASAGGAAFPPRLSAIRFPKGCARGRDRGLCPLDGQGIPGLPRCRLCRPGDPPPWPPPFPLLTPVSPTGRGAAPRCADTPKGRRRLFPLWR